jgi:hypothetical protein
MTNLGGVVKQLKKEHDRLTRQIEGISAALVAFGSAYGNHKRPGTRKKRKLSAAARKRIAEAQRKRWAVWKAKQKAAK